MKQVTRGEKPRCLWLAYFPSSVYTQRNANWTCICISYRCISICIGVCGTRSESTLLHSDPIPSHPSSNPFRVARQPWRSVHHIESVWIGWDRIESHIAHAFQWAKQRFRGDLGFESPLYGLYKFTYVNWLVCQRIAVYLANRLAKYLPWFAHGPQSK